MMCIFDEYEKTHTAVFELAQLVGVSRTMYTVIVFWIPT